MLMVPVLPQDAHVTHSGHYDETGHMCSMSRITLLSLAVPAAGPGYAERCVSTQSSSNTFAQSFGRPLYSEPLHPRQLLRAPLVLLPGVLRELL